MQPELRAYCEDFVMHNFFWLEQMYTPYRTWSGFTGGSAIEVHIYGPQEKRDQPDALLLTGTITDFYRAYPELRGHLTFQHRSAERGAPTRFPRSDRATGIKAANEVLSARGLEPWPLVDYLPPGPFVGWIEKLMVRGRKRIRARKQKSGKHE